MNRTAVMATDIVAVLEFKKVSSSAPQDPLDGRKRHVAKL